MPDAGCNRFQPTVGCLPPRSRRIARNRKHRFPHELARNASRETCRTAKLARDIALASLLARPGLLLELPGPADRAALPRAMDQAVGSGTPRSRAGADPAGHRRPQPAERLADGRPARCRTALRHGDRRLDHGPHPAGDLPSPGLEAESPGRTADRRPRGRVPPAIPGPPCVDPRALGRRGDGDSGG